MQPVKVISFLVGVVNIGPVPVRVPGGTNKKWALGNCTLDSGYWEIAH